MTNPFGGFGPFGGRGNGQRHPDGEEPVVIRDRRRIDPQTGAVREGSRGTGPFPPASDPADPSQAAQPITAEVSGASEEMAALKAELADRTADLQRLNAEYANYRKRMNRDMETAAVTGRASVAAELVPVLDDLELAKAHGDLNGAFKAVADRLVGTLQKLGLQAYGEQGDEFDPAHHEAVHFATSPDVSVPTVSSVMRRGYSFKDRPLRAAIVAVTGPEHEGDTVTTPDSGAAAEADDADRQADAASRTQQESKQDSAPSLGGEEPPAGEPAPLEDPA